LEQLIVELPMNRHQQYLTPQGMKQLEEELARLQNVRRQEVAEKITESHDAGGVEDNAEYEEAKNELAFTEGRILTLDNLINNAVIIEKPLEARETVEVGATVTVQNQDGKSHQYTITGSAEADPSQGRISNVSPIGKSLLGKRLNEVTEVNVPSGKIKLEIIAIE
jgi:transcription elongation factor GreA